MALTPVLKPKGIQPIGAGKLVYTFQEGSLAGKPNYRVQITINGVTTPTLEYRPDSTLLVSADVAPLLRYAVSLGESTAQRFLSAGTYVKYQAVWDGGSDALVNLNTDIIYPFIGNKNRLSRLGGLPAYSANNNVNVLNRTTLVPTSSLYAWNGRRSYFEFLIDGSMPINANSSVILTSGNVANSLGYVTPTLVLSVFDGTVYSMQSNQFIQSNNARVGIIGNSIIGVPINTSSTANTVKIYPGSADYGNGIGQSWRAVNAGPANRRYFVFNAIRIGKPTYSMTFRMVKFSGASPSTNPSDIVLSFTFDLSSIPDNQYSGIVIDLGAVTAALATDYFIEFVPNVDGVFDANNCYQFPQSAASTYANGSVWNKPAATFVADTNRDFFGWMSEYVGTNNGLSNFMVFNDIVTMNECQNPIALKWLTDMGSLQTFLFDYNQLRTLQPEEIGKFEKKQIYDNNITEEVWRMLNELNRDGIEYGDNKRAGQYIKDITDETNSIDVLPMPQLSMTQTKRVANDFQLTLRYPLVNNSQL